jgi:GxxExxY protein
MLSTPRPRREFPTQPLPSSPRWKRVEQEDQEDQKRFEDGSDVVIGAMIRVHRALGPGLLESAYEACVCRELEMLGWRYRRQVPVPLIYRGMEIDCAYRIDILVEERILIELKAVEALKPIHAAQVITYLKLARVPVGLLVNFNVQSLRNGLRRFSLRETAL